MVTIKEKELYQEIELLVGEEKIGDAEVEIKGKMLGRLNIFPPYQNKGYGTEIVKLLSEKYGCDVLWATPIIKGQSTHTRKTVMLYQNRPYF